MSTAIELLEKNSKNGDAKSDDNDDDDKPDNVATQARTLKRATSVVLRLIKELEKEHGPEIWTHEELTGAIRHLVKLEDQLTEIAGCAEIVDAE